MTILLRYHGPATRRRRLMWSDGWTAVTSDRRRTAQFEHTLVVTDDGADILTICAD